MRAIILSAGQGRRLMPLTANTPKCLLPLEGHRSVLEMQLDALAACGIRSVTVMVGFGAEKVESLLAGGAFRHLDIRARFNPFFAVADNLITCWVATAEMTEDFILLNGDTVFETAVLRRLLASDYAPVSVVIDRKAAYGDDDMKVTLEWGARLRAVGKAIPAGLTDGESIGLMAFRGEGIEGFRTALDRAVRNPAALSKWYLDVIDAMAGPMEVRAVSIEGLWWAEIDSPDDLAQARSDLLLRATRDVRTVPRRHEATNGAAPRALP
jgi:choline kinase